MSSFNAEMTVDNQTFPVSQCFFQIRRVVDSHGRPQSRPYWSAWISMESTAKSTIANWMLDPNKQLDVKITFSQTGQPAKFREITLSKAYCFEYRERFTSDEDYGLLRFMVMGPEVSIDNDYYTHE